MKNTCFTFFILVLAVLYLSLSSYSSGPANNNGNGYTGAPGELGITCNVCHNNGSYGVPIVDLLIAETGSNTPISGYIPSTTYEITITVNSTSPGFGFQAVAIDGDGDSAGTFQNAGAAVRFSLANNGRTYAEHDNPNNSGIFTFEWVAPSSDIGNVDFYVVGNAVSLSNGTSDDNGSILPTQLSLSAYTPPTNYVSISDNPAHSADASAVLDVQSSTKGILIPRLSQTERLAISSPATGLLVFDTDNASFWYFNGNWVELAAINAKQNNKSDKALRERVMALEEKLAKLETLLKSSMDK